MMNLNDYMTFSQKSAKLIISLFLFFTLFSTDIFSQTEQGSDSNVQQEDSTTFVMQKSPLGAVLRSALLPGFGQYYNEAYWKIPVIWGTIYYFADIWVKNNDKYKYYKNLYNESGQTTEAYKTNRDFYRDQRDEFAIYIGLAYFLNLVDAYVDAQLFDFDVSENQHIPVYQLNMRIKL
jgi:hypothetical protein